MCAASLVKDCARPAHCLQPSTRSGKACEGFDCTGKAYRRPRVSLPLPTFLLQPAAPPLTLSCCLTIPGPCRPTGSPLTPPPYGEALLAREYELWQRQAAMYERLLEQADHEQQRFSKERAAWQATEAALREEAAELRAHLLFALTKLNSQQEGGGRAAPAPPSPPGSYVGSSQQAALAAQEPAMALPSSSSAASATSPTPLSPAEQVKAVVDAMKPGGPNGAPAPPTASSSSSSSSTAWPSSQAASDAELPPYAADLAAAVAAVDTTDVLSGLRSLSLGDLKANMRSAAASSSNGTAAAPAQPPVAAAQPTSPPASPAAPTPAPRLVEQATEPVAAQQSAPRGPPPALILGADDLFWVSQASMPGHRIWRDIKPLHRTCTQSALFQCHKCALAHSTCGLATAAAPLGPLAFPAADAGLCPAAEAISPLLCTRACSCTLGWLTWATFLGRLT
jgi:hypothetical protein